MDRLILIGAALVFIGVLFMITGSVKTDVKSAGIVFIGPFPLFGWAYNKKMFYTLIGLTILFMLLWLILRKI